MPHIATAGLNYAEHYSIQLVIVHRREAVLPVWI